MYEVIKKESKYTDLCNIDNHINQFKDNPRAEELVKIDLESVLNEIGGLPLTLQYELHFNGSQLESPLFPGKNYVEMITYPNSGEEIYNARGLAEGYGLLQIEDRIRNMPESSFTALTFSPTTEMDGKKMSDMSMVEMWKYDGTNNLKGVRLTLPHREGQSVSEAFEEMKLLASDFDEKFLDTDTPLEVVRSNPTTKISEKLFFTKEFKLLASPIFLEDSLEFISGDIDRKVVVSYLDQRMTEISGVKYFMGRPIQNADIDHYRFVNEQIKEIISTPINLPPHILKEINFDYPNNASEQYSIVDWYIEASKAGRREWAQKFLNVMVNEFHRRTDTCQVDQIIEQQIQTALISSDGMLKPLPFLWDDNRPKHSKGGCGALGGEKLEELTTSLETNKSTVYGSAFSELGGLDEDMTLFGKMEKVHCECGKSWIVYLGNAYGTFGNEGMFKSNCPKCGTPKNC